MKIFVTGANGFIGSHFINQVKAKFDISCSLRRKIVNLDVAQHILDMESCNGWCDALRDCDIVLHTAAIAHKNNIETKQMHSVNVVGTEMLARASVEANVKRFIFISSIGVNGISNSSPYKFSDIPNPSEDYAISKYEAEISLKKISENTGMEVVIIRPPLVYGKNAPGNFGKLIKFAEYNFPLPFGAINNQRSFVFIDNLIDLIVKCIEHPNAANQTFLVSDDKNISTSMLIKRLTLAAGNNPLLFPVPVYILEILASIVGKKSVVERFSSSLTVDIEYTKKTLHWTPPVSLDEGIRRCFN